jgi:DNA-binding MarR family transcriptional regulator
MNSSKGITIPAPGELDRLGIISENILLFFPLFYKNILGMTRGKSYKNPINMQSRMLVMLMHSGMMQPSEIGERMGISKPNVSALVDKLVALAYVERQPDARDRRVIHIAITTRGRRFVVNRLKAVSKVIKENLSGLDTEELDSLYVALETFKRIISRLDRGGPPGRG